MKKSLLFLGILFLLTSCHIDHKIASLEIVGNKDIKGGNQIWSRIHPEEKCHKIYIWNSFTNRHTPKEPNL